MSDEPASKPVSENAESRALIDHAFQLARALGIRTLLVQADELRNVRSVNKKREQEQVIWLSRGSRDLSAYCSPGDSVIAVPDVQLSRMSQIKFGLFMALVEREMELDESIVCLSGVAGSWRLDTLLIANPRRDYPWFGVGRVEQARWASASGVFVQVLGIALRFAAEGREGKSIGTILIIGDDDELSPHLRQPILNPLEGHPQKLRNIFDQKFLESLRELSAIDGAIVINRKGVVYAAGAYIEARSREIRLEPGQGARHAAAAALTATTSAIALAISESSGTVTVFHGGESILKFDKPGQVPRSRRRRKTVSRRRGASSS